MNEPILRNETTAASRQAARRSPADRGQTGPRTRRGKARSSRNALKHGIHSPAPVIIEGIEILDDWLEFKREIVESWQPEGRFERELAERIAYLLWRLRRCRHHETAFLNYQVQSTERDLAVNDAYAQGTLAESQLPDDDPDLVGAHQQLAVIPGHRSIDRMVRNESHVHRLLLQTIHELEAAQARRRGERAPLARLDLSGPPPNLGPHRSAPPRAANDA